MLSLTIPIRSIDSAPSTQPPIRICQATKPGMGIATLSPPPPAWRHAARYVPLPLQSPLDLMGADSVSSGSRATCTHSPPLIIATLVILAPRHATSLRWPHTKVTALPDDRHCATPCWGTLFLFKAAWNDHMP